MLRDVFYYGDKPNVHPREKLALNINDARQQSTTEHFWIINEFCDYRNFDWDWDFDFLPDEDVWAQAHINVWPSNHQKDSGTWLCSSNESDTIIYRNDVDPIKYKNEYNERWVLSEEVDKTKFDYSWHPDPTDPPYIYKWGCKFFPVELKYFAEYYTPGATEIKYINDPIKLNVNWNNWLVPNDIDKDSFDFTWIPDPREPDIIYQFGTQHQKTGGPTYKKVDSDIIKYCDEQYAIKLPSIINYKTLLDVDEFDYSWHPDDTEPPYIYVFGNKWYDVKSMHTVEYHVPGATEYKYITDITAKLKPNEKAWEILLPVVNFDFSWIPEPNIKPYIYVFGNKWNDVHTEPTLMYKVEGATEYKFIEDIVATPAPNMYNWTIRNIKDKDVFDFTWRPNPNIEPAKYEWGTDGPVFTVSDYKSTIVMDYDISVRDKKVEVNLSEIVETVIERPMFYIDRGNPESFDRFNQLKLRYPQLQKTRYLNTWVDTINRCCFKSDKDLFWVLSSEIDYTDFKFHHNPNPWQIKMVHVFGTQWTHWGNTYLVNKNTFSEDTKYVKVMEHLNILNFVKDKRAKASECIYDVVVIDHNNSQYNDVVKLLETKIPNRKISSVKYKDSYLQTFRQLLTLLEEQREHYVWICSSVCDYSNFDFSYVCDPFSKEQLHTFPSEKQKFGDTFLVNINKLRELVTDMTMLEDYKKINFNSHQRVSRLPAPVIVSEQDTHCESVMQDFDFPYAIFKTSDNINLDIVDKEPMNLWANETKNIIITSKGGTQIIVPREAKSYIKRELYDYPFISTNSQVDSNLLDIVFFSNGEKCAEDNYEHLLSLNLPNRIVRIKDVNGRVKSQHEAANASNTPWYFLINAKLKVDNNFDFSWQADRLQIPKHYIFKAKNIMNGLIYGHQAIVANNKILTLNTKARGLDFTMDSEHEVVDVLSGIAIYNSSEWDTWRTAFRECIKLCYAKDSESKKRLETWKTIAIGDFAQFSLKGAQDAIDYYKEVKGELQYLLLTYEWDWLKDFYSKKL